MHPVKGGRQYQQGKCWKVSSTCCVLDANGRAVPKEYGCASSIHRSYQEWAQAGFFQKIWALGLEKYNELEGIVWEWQSLDGCMVKAPLAQEAVGHNPTDRGKNGNKAEHSDR